MKEIPNHPGYFITESGEVYSNHRKGLRKLTPQLTHRGYYKVMFKEMKGYFIHRLVCLTYLPNPDNLPQVNHIDGNKTNNHLSNLEWCTNDYNIHLGRGQHWKVKTPSGEIVEVFNLSRWCKDKDVGYGNLTRRGYSKGYTLL